MIYGPVVTQCSSHVAISPVSHLRTFFLLTDGSAISARHFSSALAGLSPGLSRERLQSSDLMTYMFMKLFM